jgi:phage terminase large subunit-like protein
MFREATGGLASRPEGMLIKLSTQSDEPPAGIFRQDLQYARDVRDGKMVDDRFLPVLYEHPPEMVRSGEHLKLENLPLVNPNFGVSVTPSTWSASSRRQNWPARNRCAASWPSMATSRSACAALGPVGGRRLLGAAGTQADAGRPARALRGGRRRDRRRRPGRLARPVGGRPRRGNPRVAVWCHAWAHPSVLERRKEIAPRLQDFEKTAT